ncbi:tumor necrosis factor receptor superfamily member 6B-like [Xyrichtys novacula]|nr:tumor necrosis factor receptor superfamily member 6B-like [Xyrichtys novacula]
MLILPVLFLISNIPHGEADPTYERHNPLTGEINLCTMCPPGTHMTSHCTATSPTKCDPCKKDHYTELWNYLPRCLYCGTICQDNMEVETECSAFGDRVCRCKEGYYMIHDFCARHSECEPGHGAHTEGTPRKNTVCRRCSEGTFSNSSSASEPCINHQTCASGQAVLMPGSIFHDTVCGSCEDLANNSETLRRFLIGFLNEHKMPAPKLRKLISKYIRKSVERRRPLHRRPLTNHVTAWLAEATQEQLIEFPEMLKAAQLNSLTRKLEMRLEELRQQSPNCHIPLSFV